MDDRALRRQLLRSSLLEFTLLLGLGLTSIFYFGSLLREALERGSFTLYAGGQVGLATPVTLEFARTPFAAAGALLILGAFTTLAASMAFLPGYQLLRRAAPSLKLPRRSALLARLAKPLALLLLFLGGLGAALVAVQYATSLA
jgi:hypothetical protein